MNQTLTQLKKTYLEAKESYYNENPSMSDKEFDDLEDQITKLDPKWEALTKTGVKTKKTEVRLNHPMPSLSKFYPDQVSKWLAKMNSPLYTIMDKLDGSSLQVTYQGGKPVSVVTRGDGELGGEISFLIPHLNLPKVAYTKKFVFRAEALMTRKNFTKYSSEFENSRNMVNGLLNRRTPHSALGHIDIVVLGIFGMSLKGGLQWASELGLATVFNKTLSVSDSKEFEALLQLRKVKSKYDIDGLVVAPTCFKLIYETSDKPKDIIAFKVNEDSAAPEVKVQSIIWQVSKHGRIIPKLEIEPTKIDGVTVTYCTVHNAEWMQERKIGPGAVVKILRSGGVIPKIVEVVKPGKFSPPAIEYSTDGVHFVVSKADLETKRGMTIKQITSFLEVLGIEGAKAKTVAALYDSGFNSIIKFLKIPTVNGRTEFLLASKNVLGPKGEAKLLEQFRTLYSTKLSIKKLMVASGIFGVGIGERKLSMIENAGLNLSDLNEADLVSQLETVKGFGDASIEMIRVGLPTWKKLESLVTKLGYTLDSSVTKKVKTSGKLSGQLVSWTGYRSKEEEAWVTSKGGEVVSFGSKTTILLYKKDGKASSKVDKAAAKGIKIMSFNELEKL